MRHVAGLDGVRGIAILLVLLSHSVSFGEFTFLRGVGHGAGTTGVSLFFVLSGYLITRLLLVEEQQRGRISLGFFFLRRALRLFPALWLYLLVVWVIWMSGKMPEHPWHSFVASLLYVRNLVGYGHETDHLWSLSLEEQFYLAWPVVMVVLSRRTLERFRLAIAFLLVVTAWRMFAAHFELAGPVTLYERTDFRADAPIFGCCLAMAEHLWPSAVGAFTSPRRSVVLSVAGLVALTVWVALQLENSVIPGLAPTVVGVIGVAMITSQLGRESFATVALSWRPLSVTGRISYGLYLWQQLFLGPPDAFFAPIRRFPIGLIATFGVATVSYLLLERPILRYKDAKLHAG